MFLIGFDLETTGLETETCEITELAAVFFDTRLRRVIQSFTALVNIPAAVELPDHCAKRSNLDRELLSRHGWDLKSTLLEAFPMMAQADAVIAHNGNRFDRPVLLARAKSVELSVPGLPWIDTMTDFAWGEHVKGKTMGHIASDLGFVNPFPHEAGPDVLTLLRAISFYDEDVIVDAFDNATQEKVVLWADVSFDEKDLAKAAGFSWDVSKKMWLKTIRADKKESFKKDLTFACSQIKSIPAWPMSAQVGKLPDETM